MDFFNFVVLFLINYSFSVVVPTIEIARNVHMPLQGLGTWLYDDDKAGNATLTALNLGYVHIDTAFDYENSKGIGYALRQSSRSRSSYFITTKVPGGLTPEETMQTHEQNLADLGLSYVDLLLIHFPCTMEADPKCSKENRQEQWQTMQALQIAGKTRAIGVSHYCKAQMLDLLQMEGLLIKPAINQVEYHIGMGSAGPNATDDKEWMEENGITYQSFSPLCGPCCMGADPSSGCTFNTDLIKGDMVTKIGAKYNKTGPQVSLRWQTQQGIPVIPKTSNPEHLKANMDIFDFVLSDKDMDTLSGAKSPPVCGGGDGETSGDCALYES